VKTTTSAEQGWLAAAAEPGRTPLRVSAFAGSLQTLFTCVQWAGLALIAQASLTQPRGPSLGGGLILLVVGGASAALAGYAADRNAARAGLAIEDGVRIRLLPRLLPHGARSSELEPATAARTTLESVDEVADYLTTAGPLRYSRPVSMATVFVLTALVHWPAAVILALATLVIPFNLRLAGAFAKEGNDRYLSAIQQLGAIVLDSFRGLATLRRFHAVDQRRGALAKASDRLTEANMSVLKRAFISGVAMDVVVTFSIAVVATYVGLALLRYVAVPGVAPIDLASGLFVLLLCPLYFRPLTQLASAYHDRERAVAASRTILAVLADDAFRPAGDTRQEQAIAAPATPVAWSLDVRDMVCSVDEQTILTVPRLAVPAGRWTAVMGKSGAGKTTLLRLLAGLQEPSSGTVRWVSGSRSEPPVLGQAAWIGQSTVILDGTIVSNIRLARPDADDEAVRLAADEAGLTPLLGSRAAGLETVVGENGFGLSAGEARRVAIARALLRGSRLWILDEPTAHLDPDSERDIVAALVRASARCTVIVATHSPRIAAVADSIWMVSDGRVEQVTAPSVTPVTS